MPAAKTHRISNYGDILSLSYARQGRERLLKLTHPAKENHSPVYSLPAPDEQIGSVVVSAGQLVLQHFPHKHMGSGTRVGFFNGDRTDLRWENLFWYDPSALQGKGLLSYLNRPAGLDSQEAVQRVVTQLKENLPYARIAIDNGVSEQSIKDFAKKQGHRRRPRLTPEAKGRIVERLQEGESAKMLAAEYGVNRVTIWRIEQELQK